MVTATSNGVNLADGLDGLATGASVMTFLAFILIGVWEFGQSCAISASSNCYNVRDPLGDRPDVSRPGTAFATLEATRPNASRGPASPVARHWEWPAAKAASAAL